uniref:NADH dehydrogenase subunit 4 n=1 Tax=Ctenolepisma longicaudatum TaxID=27554 RepID=UPI002435FA2B|nr:NADH dehydrogenase subunit 4 [Ctenolepisma longicaudatum]WEX31828.1 NADH dehydrogenase subunit 4 [Ctenolepisma longicaudatum]
MLKYLLFMVFLIPLGFVSKMWWVVQNLLFVLCFLLIIDNCTGLCPWGLGYNFWFDNLSYSLVLLTVWIIILMIMASESILSSSFYPNGFIGLVMMLLLLLYLSFVSTNLFMFYLFFEGSLIPTLFLILGWGYQPERVQAGVYLLLYTLLASLPLLVGILYLEVTSGSMTIYSLWFVNFGGSFLDYLWYYGMVLAFLVKMPMFLVHLWLPKAHVEAPVSGSMILAGVLLKLGGYGLFRVYPFLESIAVKLNLIWFGISIVGVWAVSLICLRQVDVKSLIAYSSVAHMGLVLMGVMTLGVWGFKGALALMIAHGLCSSGLFCLANISYERLGSRSLLINSGMMSFMPSLTLWWFLLSIANMAAPPSLNLLGEISLLNSIVGWSSLSMIGLSLMSFFSAAYTLYLYSYSQHGKYYSGLFSCWGGSVREYYLLFLHWFPLNFLILFAGPSFLWL